MKLLPTQCLVAALLVCTCRRQATSDRAPPPVRSAAPALTASAVPAGTTSARAVSSEPAIRELLSRWVEAQNRADFAAYETLYAKAFLGIKRVGAQTFRFDRTRWLLDRKGMFSHAPKVGAAGVQITDLGQIAVVRFEQTFESGEFRDVGQKQLTLVRESAAFVIAREEMLTSFQTVPAGVPSFPELAFVEHHAGRPFVLLERSNLPFSRAEYVDFELSVSAIVDDATLPEARRGLAGRGVLRARGRSTSARSIRETRSIR
ncbi:MAG TPA: nuclear transport factor 2 family protein [Polyangiaceae bacterium]|nr:nuclear transport factor 2 family protein [Polyangiaceae bacterium]